MKLALVLILGLTACSSQKPPTTTTAHKPESHEQMSPELTKFHDVISPRWHAEKGPQRMTDTCAAIGDFQTAAAPLGNNLVDAVVALDATCKANDPVAFETAFAKVHMMFHGLMEGGEHGEHRERDHSM